MAIRKEWTIGGLTALVGLVAGLISLWPNVGWMTPKAHSADIVKVESDHETVNEAILDAIKELKEQGQNTRDEWKCDEYDEELLDLLREQVDNDSVETQHQIEKIREKMRQLRCDRFEDFG